MALLFFSTASQADSSRAATEQVSAQLIASVRSVQPGTEILLGVHQQIIPHWHTYWINPGDSGIATSIVWKLPPGATAGDIQWPLPSHFQLGPVTNYGYANEVTLLSPIRVPADAAVGSTFTAHATVDWLVCREECIPQQVELSLSLPVTVAGSSPHQGNALIEAARSRLPVESPWPARVEASKGELRLYVAGKELDSPTIQGIRFYPTQWGNISHSAGQTRQAVSNGISLTLTPGEAPVRPGETLSGVLVISEAGGNGLITRGFTINATVPQTVVSSDIGLATALALALIGGIILNLMPCVFPVLSIKALSLLQHARQSAQQARLQGIAYTLGVLASFGLLGTLLIALKAGGNEIGWGFQFQSPLFVLFVAYLVFAVGLSLSGVFSIGGSVAGIGSSLADRPGYAGSFFTGVLATVVATPCTAPFMAAAVGYALTQPPAVLLAIFLSLGFGLALPYLTLSAWPALQRRLPRPGPWMDKTKEALAFPMYGTAAWLVWVLAQQAGANGIAIALGGMVIIAFSAWLYGVTRQRGSLGRHGAAGIATLAVASALLGGIAGIESAPACAAVPTDAEIKQSTNTSLWEPYSAARLAALRGEGKPVFLNFTAAWCITCLVNERIALSSNSVSDAFRTAGITYLKGDWTNRDQQITEKLTEFGRSGVPLYVYYPPGNNNKPQVLPQILTPEIVLTAVSPTAFVATRP